MPRITLIAAATLAALAVSAPAASAEPSAGVQSPNRVTAPAWAAGRAAHGPNPTAREALDAYWTPARMRAAKPAELDPGDGRPTASAASARRPVVKGRPLAVPPARGKLKPRARASWYTTYANYWTPEAYLNGKVFFTRGGQARVCSGSIVNTPGKNSVWTAGHCVYDSGQWSQNWVFVPAYDDDLSNPRPYGTWYSRALFTTNEWYNSRSFAADEGVAIMWPNGNGYKIADYFGGHGFLANQSATFAANAFGYPVSGWNWDGGNLIGCAADAKPSDRAGQIWMTCEMSGGASGGPWLRYYNGGVGYVNGLNSHMAPGIWYSPYFGNAAAGLYNYTRNY